MFNRKKIAGALLIIFLGVNSQVFAIDNHQQLQDALDAVAADGTVTVDNPITLTGDIVFPGVNFTIDTIGAGEITTNGHGFIYPDNVKIDNLKIDGITNYANLSKWDSGGAIDNRDYSTFTINGGATFTRNNAGFFGGAIYNDTNSTFTIDGNAIFKKNTAGEKGGAIWNRESTITIDGSATFTGNEASYGGAIYNYANTPGISIFTINDGAIFKNNIATDYGGAISNYSYSTFTINNEATFTGNKASTYGGAIWNASNSTFTINNGATFTSNEAGSRGGAIDNTKSILNLIARTNDVTFTGNTANGISNAVHIRDDSVMNLNASDSAGIIFNDRITSENNNNIININQTGTWDRGANPNNPDGNKLPDDAPTTGRIVLNADMSGFTNSAGNAVNLYGGTLALGADGVMFSSHFVAHPGSTFDLVNGVINNVVFSSAEINDMNLKIDVNMNNNTADTLESGSFTGTKNINLTKITVIQDGANGTVTVVPANDLNLSLNSRAQTASGPVYNYNVINNQDGTLTLNNVMTPSGTPQINPAVQASGVASQSAYLALSNTNNIVFNKADNVMATLNNIRLAKEIQDKYGNKLAVTEGMPIETAVEQTTLFGRLAEGDVWLRPFNSIEKVKIDNLDGRVNSVSYGLLTGFDTPLRELRANSYGMMSFFGGYSGASQKYSTVNSYQNGGLVGTSASLYKGNGYTTLAATVGGYGVTERIATHGTSNYGMLTTSVASKTGYNINLPKNTIFQLNNQLAYSLVTSQDYTNAQGANIDTSPLHFIQLIPGAKLTGNIRRWQPYISANVIFNPLSSTTVTANEIALPDSAIGTYAEYGVGIQSDREDRLNGFAQVMVRNGSRTGVNFNFGLKSPVGRKSVAL